MEVTNAITCKMGDKEWIIAGASGEQQVIDLETMKVYSLSTVIYEFLDRVA